MAKQCFVVQSGNNSVEVFEADTQDGRQRMLRWVEKRVGGSFSSHEKMLASRIMEGDFSQFSSTVKAGYNVPVVFFSEKKNHRAINVVLGTFGEPA